LTLRGWTTGARDIDRLAAIIADHALAAGQSGGVRASGPSQNGGQRDENGGRVHRLHFGRVEGFAEKIRGWKIEDRDREFDEYRCPGANADGVPEAAEWLAFYSENCGG